MMKIFKSFTNEVIELLKNGKVGIIPTDTLYGIVADLSNQSAVERILDIKNRPLTEPVGTIIFNDPTQVENYVTPAELLAAEVYWPGPTSVILNTGNKLAYAHRGLKSLPFRVPDRPELRQLIKQTGPLATTSANRSQQPPAASLEEAMGVFRESVDFYVDGGDLSNRKPSKIIRILKDGNVETLR